MIVERQREIQKEELVQERERLALLLNEKISVAEGSMPLLPAHPTQIGELSAQKAQIFPRKPAHLDEISDIHMPMALGGPQSPSAKLTTDIDSRVGNLDITQLIPGGSEFVSPTNRRQVAHSNKSNNISSTLKKLSPREKDSVRSILEQAQADGENGTPDRNRMHAKLQL